VTKCICCEKNINKKAKFCPYCGSTQVDNCPDCLNLFPLFKNICSDCGTIFRYYCEVCHHRYIEYKDECEISDCNGSLINFYMGFSSYGVCQQRSSAISDFAVEDFLEQDFPTLWKYSTKSNISDVYSFYGKIFWIDNYGNVISMSELNGPESIRKSYDKLRNVKSEPLNIRNIIIHSDFYCFFSKYKKKNSIFCYDVNSLSKIKQLSGNYISYIVTKGKLFLFKNSGNNLTIDCYDFFYEKIVQSIVLKKDSISETIAPVFTGEYIYFVTTNNKLYCLDIIKFSLEEVMEENKDLVIKQPCYSNGFLRFIAMDNSLNPYICNYSLSNKKLIKQRLVDVLPFYQIALSEDLLFIYDTGKSEILMYKLTETLGGFLPEPESKRLIGAGEELRHQDY